MAPEWISVGLQPKSWHKAYHGTAANIIGNMVKQGLLAGDGRRGSVGAYGRKTIYASPAIEYAARSLYAINVDVDMAVEDN